MTLWKSIGISLGVVAAVTAVSYLFNRPPAFYQLYGIVVAGILVHLYYSEASVKGLNEKLLIVEDREEKVVKKLFGDKKYRAEFEEI